jgi:sugar phosphate isomerase/epimerase
MAPKGQNADEDGWADVGKGEIDWPSIMDLARKTRTLHYVMEHDNPSDLERFARRSFDYVSKL